MIRNICAKEANYKQYRQIERAVLGVLPTLRSMEAGLQVELYCSLCADFLHPPTQDIDFLAFSFLKILCSNDQLKCEIN